MTLGPVKVVVSKKSTAVRPADDFNLIRAL